MTKDEAITRALDAFADFGERDDFETLFVLTERMSALREIMNQPEAGPAAVVVHTCMPGDYTTISTSVPLVKGQGLYESAQERPWNGLTTAEFDRIWEDCDSLIDAMYAVMDKLKEKNT